ncbi:MAG: ankyrin repeat domain-containing protein [Cytophagaceae bacterium]|nr:MAG: ankyrin repeat domain-containing protein [Cytophagaceae bacterium]
MLRKSGRSCFDDAVERCDTTKAIYLRELGWNTLYDPNHNYGQYPRICWALNGNNLKLVTTYLAVGGIDKRELDHALHIAADNNEVIAMELLLDQGASPNGMEHLPGQSPLVKAAASGKAEQVRILLRYGADCNVRDLYDKTAFQIAKGRGDKKIVALLTQAKK